MGWHHVYTTRLVSARCDAGRLRCARAIPPPLQPPPHNHPYTLRLMAADAVGVENKKAGGCAWWHSPLLWVVGMARIRV